MSLSSAPAGVVPNENVAQKQQEGVALTGRYSLHRQVSLRPEPFGALAYHFGNRRLSFLRSHDMVTVVNALADQPSVQAALEAADVSKSRWPAFLKALSVLESSEMICVRD